jgi:hypothetical protein
MVVALGVPGQVDGRATLQTDRGDETQALFMYQWVAGVITLASALAANNSYVAIWCEHHDDLLAELPTGDFDALQVKTVAKQGATWRCADKGFIDAIRKFGEHEAKYSSKISRYIFFSNAKPYVPAATVTKSETLASSPMRVRAECHAATCHNSIAAPYDGSFNALSVAVGVAPALLFNVLRKLEFQQGPPLEGFRDHLCTVLWCLAACADFNIRRIEKLRDELLLLIGKASSLAVPSLDLYSSILQSDGRPEAASRAKRISVEDFEMSLKQHSSDAFRYAAVGGHLQLGKASGQMEVLRQKMNAGFVGTFFDSVWLQAMAAEKRLLERALTAPEDTLRITKQLEAVMIVECQNAEALAALEQDDRRRGLLIFQKILHRTEQLAQHDAASVEHERAETLRGVAGLLSGSCKFAWGVPINTGDSDGS